MSDTLVVDIGDDPSPPAKRARPQTTFDWPSNESIANYDWGTDYEPSVRMVSNQKAAPSPPPAQTISAFKEPVEVVDLSKDDVVEVLGSPPSNQAQKTPHRIPIRQTKSPADEEDQVVNTTVREPVASPPPENDIEAIQLSPATSVEVEKGAVAFCNGLAEVYDLPPTPPNKIQRRAILRRGSTHLNKFARPVLEPSNESVQEVPGTPTPQKERETAPVESASTANDAEDIAVEQPNDTQNASASIQPQVPVTTTESVPRPQETAEPPSSHKEKKSKKSFKRNRRRKEMNIPEWLTKGWRELFYRQRALEKKYEKAVEEGRSVDEIEARREIVNIFLELFEAKWKKSKFLDIHYEQYTDARRQIKEHYGDIQVPTIESDEVAKLIADHVALNGRPSPSLSSDPDINSTTPEPCEVTQTQRSSVETSMQTQNELIAAVSKNAGAESSYSSLPMLLQDNAAGTATQPSSATRELSIELTTESGVPEATTSRSDRVPATKTTTAATSTTRQGVNSTPTDAGLGSGQGASSKAAPVIAKAPANKAHVARKSPYEDIDSDFDLEKFNITSNKKSKKKYSGKASNAAVKEPKSDNQPIPYRGAVSSPVVSADKPSFMSFSQPTPSFSRHPDLSIAKPARPSLKALLDEQNANHNNDGAKGATPKPKGGAADRSNGNGNYRSNGKAREGWTLLDKASSKPRK